MTVKVVDGKVVAYAMLDFMPADPEKAEMVEVHHPDGSVTFGVRLENGKEKDGSQDWLPEVVAIQKVGRTDEMVRGKKGHKARGRHPYDPAREGGRAIAQAMWAGKTDNELLKIISHGQDSRSAAKLADLAQAELDRRKRESEKPESGQGVEDEPRDERGRWTKARWRNYP